MSATEESVQENLSPEQAAEEKANNFLFGEPVEEGAEAEVVETEEVELSEEEEAAAKQVEDEHSELFEFTVGENTYEVPEELKEELEKAKDYTEKTQGVKREWETAQTKIEELKTLAQNYEFAESVREEQERGILLGHLVQTYNDHLTQNVRNMAANEVTEMQLQIRQLETEQKAIADSLQVKYKDHQQAQKQAQEELLNKSTDVLRQKIPNWGEDKDKALRTYALGSGYTEAEYDALVDPRLKETLWKAQQFDQAKAGIEGSRQKVAAKKIKTSARNPMPKSTQDKLNLRKKLKSQNLGAADKANLIGENIAKRLGM